MKRVDGRMHLGAAMPMKSVHKLAWINQLDAAIMQDCPCGLVRLIGIHRETQRSQIYSLWKRGPPDKRIPTASTTVPSIAVVRTP